jgi:hypothetical protein
MAISNVVIFLTEIFVPVESDAVEAENAGEAVTTYQEAAIARAAAEISTTVAALATIAAATLAPATTGEAITATSLARRTANAIGNSSGRGRRPLAGIVGHRAPEVRGTWAALGEEGRAAAVAGAAAGGPASVLFPPPG